MTIGPRAKLLALAAHFLLPIAASFVMYYGVRPQANSNYGELLLPPLPLPQGGFARAGGGRVQLADLGGQWILLASDAAACEAGCRAKLDVMRQVRLALGRRAPRVTRVLLVDRGPGNAAALAADEGLVVLQPLHEPAAAPPQADRDHIYLVDPRGNVMLRWPAAPDMKRMLRDLDRLLRASQIG
jgi:hypothetical protein